LLEHARLYATAAAEGIALGNRYNGTNPFHPLERIAMRNMMQSLVVAVGAAALLVGASALPARADDDGWRGRGHERREHEWREHEWREHERREWCEHHPYQCGYPPGVYYAPPPPVVYAPPPPPPVVYAPAPSLDIVVPIHIR
jgi:hypothetical protein